MLYDEFWAWLTAAALSTLAVLKLVLWLHKKLSKVYNVALRVKELNEREAQLNEEVNTRAQELAATITQALSVREKYVKDLEDAYLNGGWVDTHLVNQVVAPGISTASIQTSQINEYLKSVRSKDHDLFVEITYDKKYIQATTILASEWQKGFDILVSKGDGFQHAMLTVKRRKKAP